MAGAGMSRILGIGFLVGAKDQGATETFEEVTTSSDKMADSIARVGTDSPKQLDRLNTSIDTLSGTMTGFSGTMTGSIDRGFDRLIEQMQSMARAADNVASKKEKVDRFKEALEALSFLRLGNIADTLNNIADAAGVGVGAQSTALESFGAQFGQTYRQATAGMGRFQGLVDDVRGQVSGVAFSLQIGAEQMLQPITQLASQGRRLEDFGITVRQLGGAIQAGLIDSATFGQGLTELTNTYGMSEEAAGGLLDRITAIGESFGIGRAAVSAFPQALEAIRPLAARFPEIEQNAGAAVESMVRLGSAIQMATGTDSQASMSQATAIMQRLGESRGGLQDLITGLGSEFDGFVTELGIGAGSIDEAISMAMQDPARFAMSMARLMQSLGEGDPMGQRLASTLGELSPGLLQLVRSGNLSAEAMDAMVRPVENAEGAFGRMSEAASGSTRTFQEQLDLMRDRFVTRLNSIGRATDRDFLPRQQRAYQRVGNTIERFARDQGPLGMLTRGFLRVRTFGLVQGLLPQLGALTEGLGDTAAAFGSTMRVLGDIGILGSLKKLTTGTGAFSKVLKGLGFVLTRFVLPVALVSGAIYLLYRYGDRLPEMFERISAAVRSASVWVANIGERFSDWVSGIDWQRAGRTVADGVGGAIASAFEWLMAPGGTVGNEILNNFYNGFRDIFSSVGRMIYGLATGIWESWQEGMAAGGGGGAFLTYLRSIWIDPIQRTIRVVWAIFSAFGRVVGTIFGNVWERISGVFSGLSEIFGGDTDATGWFDALSNSMNASSAALGWLVGVFEGAMDLFASALSPVYDALFDFLLTPIDDFIAIMEQNGPTFRLIWEDLSQTIADLGYIFGDVSAVIWDFWDGTMSPVIDAWWAAWERLTGDTEESSATSFRRIGVNSLGMWARIKDHLRGAVGAFRTGFAYIVNVGTSAWRTLTIGAYNMGRRVEGFIERIRIAWEGVQRIMGAGWGVVEAETRRSIGGIVLHVQNTFDALFFNWERMVLNLKMTLLDTATAILGGINAIIGRIPAALLPGPLRTAQEGLRSALTGVEQETTRHRETMARRLAEMTDDERRRQEAFAQAQIGLDAAVATSRNNLTMEQANLAANVARSRGREERDIQRVTDAVDAQVTAIRRGAKTADQALAELDERLASGAVTGERQQRERVRASQALLNDPAIQAMLERVGTGRGGAERRRDVEAAIVERGGGTESALTRAEIRNLSRWAEQVPERGQGRTSALASLAEMISGEGEIAAPPRPVEPPSRTRGAARRRAGSGGPSVTSLDDETIRRLSEGTGDATARGIVREAGGTVTAPPGGGARPSGRGAAATPTEYGEDLSG